MTTAFIVLWFIAGTAVFSTYCEGDRSRDSALIFLAILIVWPFFVLAYFQDLP